jgi:phosphoglycerate dehydrogenase-like enzyme
MLGQCEVLAIAAPLTPHTDRLIDRTALAALKPGALVINVGRAAILDTDALIAALRRGHLGGASLDVFPEEPLPADHPLWTAPNVLLTPHTSGFRHGHWDDVIDVFADNLQRYMSGEPLRFEVAPGVGY